MDTREAKALEIAARMRLTFKDGAWIVPSSSGNGSYQVVLKPGGNTCTCPHFELAGKDCKHVLAALFVCERDYGGQPLLIDTDTLPEKKTYSQDWRAYQLAQATEKNRFQAPLHDLCSGLAESPSKGGRRPHLVKDSVFAMTFKVYCTLSARRFNCYLQDAHAKGYLTKPIPGLKVNSFLENEAFTPILRPDCAEQSAAPDHRNDVRPGQYRVHDQPLSPLVRPEVRDDAAGARLGKSPHHDGRKDERGYGR